ncbi:MAG: stage II sporulation protein M [Pyrinomonadaceae bacterium]
MNRFISDRKDRWQRLEDLLGLLRGTGLRGLSRAEVREFGELYRRAATDLAIARAETRDPKLINYLNSLVIRTHGKIYRSESEGASIIKRFFAVEFPRAVRESSRFSLLAFGVFFLFGMLSFALCVYDKEFGTTIGLDEIRMAAESDLRWWERLNNANQIGSSEILTNNIRVAFMAFAFGAFFGIGTLYILLMNGISIGGVIGICYSVNPAFAADLVTFMVAHGVLELTSIFIAGGAGMTIGYALIDPGDLTRRQALKKAGNLATKVVIGCACVLFVAGLIEGFLSPSALPPIVKFATGGLTGLLLFAYVMLAGRREQDVSTLAS